MTFKTRFYLHLVVDRSGSMMPFLEDMLSGLNQQLEKIRELQHQYTEQEIALSISWFNDHVEHLNMFASPFKVYAIKPTDYRPVGTTALYDAIASCIRINCEAIGDEIVNNDASIMMVVITDGADNSSVHYTLNQVRRIVGAVNQRLNWKLAFASADPNAMEMGIRMGFDKNHIIASHNVFPTSVFHPISRLITLHIESQSILIKQAI